MVEGNEQGWTFETLKSYVDERFKSADLAITKTEISIDKRFGSVNEFRSALNDFVAQMIPRAEYNFQHETLIERIIAVEKRIEAMQLAITEQGARDVGKKQGLGLLGTVIVGTIATLSSIALIISIVVHFFTK